MQKALLIIEARNASSTHELAKGVDWIDKEFELLSISSIYELKNTELPDGRSRKIHLMQSQSLTVAVSIETSLGAQSLLDKMTIKQAEINKATEHSSVHFYLVFYAEHVSMLKNLYLPHPSWIKRKDWVLASSDVWPNYEHPILEEKLAIIGRNRKIRPGDYFFAQGKVLLNAQMPAT